MNPTFFESLLRVFLLYRQVKLKRARRNQIKGVALAARIRAILFYFNDVIVSLRQFIKQKNAKLVFFEFPKWIVLLLLFLIMPQVYADININPVVLNTQQATFDLQPHAEIYFDPTNKLTVQQVSNLHFILHPTQKTELRTATTNWVRFKVMNPTDQDIELFLTNATSMHANNIFVYIQNQQGQFSEVPRKIVSSFQPFLFTQVFPAHSSRIYYLAFYYENYSGAINYILQKPYTYAVRAMDRYFMLGTLFGIPLALLLNSLFIYFLLRDKGYLLYVLFVTVYILYNILEQGLLNGIPNYAVSASFYVHNSRFLITLMGFSYVLFVKNVLQVPHYLPRLTTVMNVYLVAAIPLAVLSYLNLNNFYYSTLHNSLLILDVGIYAIIGFILAFIAAVRVTLKGYQPARYYLAGMICLLIGVISQFLDTMLIFHIPIPVPTTLGLNADMILQAIALAVRFNLIQEAELTAQKEIVHQKELNVEIHKQALLTQQELTLSYARFFPHAFLKMLHKKSITDVKLGDNIESNMTVLFVDLRDFTTILETKSPAESFEFINAHLKNMGPTIRKHGGFIDKYVGDAILALFKTNPANAILTAITIFQLLQQSNVSIDMGIGIHYGSLMLGTIGEEKRMDGTVISDTVNTTSRLEDLNKLYKTHILITKQATDALTNKERFKLRFIDHLYMKGKHTDIKIYEVFDIDPPDIIEKKIQLMPDYDKAIGLYQKQQFKEALHLFEQCRHALPNDKVIALYIDRCKKWLTSPPPESWKAIAQFSQVMEVT